MLLPTAPQYRKRRGRLGRATLPNPPVTGVLVVSVVSLHDGSGYRWTFDTPIVSATTEMANGYEVDGNDPGDAGDPVGNHRDLYYGFDTVGLPWAIVGVPTDIVFAGGLTIEPGQSGITT